MSINAKKLFFFLITFLTALLLAAISGSGFLHDIWLVGTGTPENIFGNPFYKMVALKLNIGMKLSFLPVLQLCIVSMLVMRLLLKSIDWKSFLHFGIVFVLLALFSPLIRISSDLASNAFGLILFLQLLVIFRSGRPKFKWYDIPFLLLGIWLFPHDFDLSFDQAKFIDYESRSLILFIASLALFTHRLITNQLSKNRFAIVASIVALLVWLLEHFAISSTPFLSSIAVSIFVFPLAEWIMDFVIKAQRKEALSFGTLFLAVVLFSVGIHKSSHLEKYHSPIWADKGGYFVYLPATFIHGFSDSPELQTESLKNGQGFYFEEGKLMTKYSIGSAILMSPLYMWQVVCDSSANVSGFEEQYTNVVLIAGSLYFVLALFFLWRTLLLRYKKQTAIWILTAVAFSTNVIFYAVDEAGMSHIYSFFCFSLLIWVCQKAASPNYRNVITMAVASALLVLCRPINIIAIVPILFIFSSRNFWRQLNVKLIAIAILTGLALCSFQMLYWNFSWGGFIIDTYGSEGFILDKFPPIKMFLFSPNNGYLLYAPLMCLFFIALFHVFFQSKLKGALYALVLAGTVILFASWEDVFYGCGFGSRVMLEYFAIFCFPLASFFDKNSKNVKSVLWIFTVLLIVLNIHIMFNFDECYFSTNPWDWNEYLKLLTKGVISS